MQIWDTSIQPENIPALWRCARRIGKTMGTWIVPGLVYCRTDFESEGYLLYLDFMCAYKRYGRRDYAAIADYLLPGREHWGNVWMLKEQ
jgi:hypothetical protein